MIRRADLSDTVAVDAAARIVAAVRSWRIILFGSRARGTATTESDYDFYVEVDAEEAALHDIDRRIREALRSDQLSFDLKLMPRGSLERRRDDPGTIEWDVAREGKLLFADPAAPTAIAPSTRVRERPRKTPESVAEWIEAAERDIRHSADLWQLGHDYWPEICGLSQQMCEKFMKALLVSRFVRPERTHDLTKLLAALRTSGVELAGLDGDCALLEKHAITPRYPNGLSLTEQDARDASDAAGRIVAAVRAALG